MKKQLIAATAAACFSIAGITAPASAEVPITLKGGVGYWFFDHEVQDFDVDDTETPFVGLEYVFDDNWAAEVLFADANTDFKDGPGADVSTWQLGGRYYWGSYIGEPMRVRPYLALGGGQIKFDAHNQFDDVDTTVNGGAGVRWMLSDRVGMDVEGRAVHSTDDNETDYLVSAGLNIYLGKVAMAGAATQCADADGDGVCDDKDRCPGTAPGTRVGADGCTLPVAEVASIKLKVNFAFDSSKVQERYFADIKELAEFLQRFSDLQVNVEGHTDSIGTEEYNKKLSQRRAQAVVDVLVNQYGIARSRLEPMGFGESQPVASNDTADGRAQNRRVMATLEVEFKE